MPKIRLLTSVVGDGPVVGQPGDILDVDAKTARVWADGERAERLEKPEKGRREVQATVTRETR